MSAGIYKLTSPSGKCYIGQSVNLSSRLNKYKNGHIKTQSYIYNAINKYGFETFKSEILFKTTKDYKHIKIMLDALEKRFIKVFKSSNPEFGYNLMSGGTLGYRHSEITKKKMSNAAIGKPKSDETKRKISEAKIGTKRTKEANEKISKALANRFIVISQYDKYNNFIREWNGAVEVEKELGISKSNICNVLKGKRKTAGGFIWKYNTKEV